MRKGEDGQFYCLGCDYVNRNKNTVKGRLSLVWSVKGRLSLPVNMPIKLPVSNFKFNRSKNTVTGNVY